MKPVAVLVGPPGAGKTTIGTALAQALGVTFRDTDTDIEQGVGKPVSDIFVDEGEDHFRALEKAAVRNALSTHDGVLGLGGGAVLDKETRALLSELTVVSLTVELGEAVHRVGLDQGRPLLAVNPRATLRFLMEMRKPFYKEIATHTVDTTGRTPEDIVSELVKAIA